MSFDESKKQEIIKKSWEQFCETGMLWAINRILHIFGWSIIYEFRECLIGDETITILKNVYPARVSFRGFSREAENNGYIKITKFLADNSKDLLKELLSEELLNKE